MNPWRKFFLFTGIVGFPAVMVGKANYDVFPDAYFLSTMMLSATVLIAALFTWKSNQATARVVQYCIIADVILCLILCVNLGGHWWLKREHSAAKAGLAERHTEEDREEKRRAAADERQLKLTQAEADLERTKTAQINAESRRLSRLPIERRQTILAAPRSATPAESPQAIMPVGIVEQQATAEAKPKRLTPDEVIEKFSPFLSLMSFLEVFAAVFLGAVLLAVWEWDKNRNNIPDHLETSQPPQYQTPAQPRPLFTGNRPKK